MLSMSSELSVSGEQTSTGAGSHSGARRSVTIYRHPAIIRITHWIGVFCFLLLLPSGLQILSAHPALYFGQKSDFSHPVASIGSKQENGRQVGYVEIAGHALNTTGFLGSFGPSDDDARAFPAWATLPSYQDLATGRRWHFFFAWLLVADGLFYLIYSFAGGHVWSDLVPSARQMRHIGRTTWNHLLLRFPHGEAAKRYNVLQKLSYLAILLVVVPLLVLSGLTMSPGMDATVPFLADLLGGRQTARTIHFLCAFTLVAFVIVHVVMVLVSGFWNNMRSMITGWYDIKPETELHGRTN
jgi:thiosulfate reductase cytochrome b subunit